MKILIDNKMAVAYGLPVLSDSKKYHVDIDDTEIIQKIKTEKANKKREYMKNYMREYYEKNEEKREKNAIASRLRQQAIKERLKKLDEYEKMNGVLVS